MATYTNKNGTNEADVLTYNKAGTYYAYSGKDTITINGGIGVIVHAGAGNNVINVTGGSGHTVKSAYTEAEGETIASADKLTIDGADMVEAILGSGRDEIIIKTTNGRKSDGSLAKIKGGSWTDTFTVNSGAQKYQLYGEAGDDIFTIKGGSNIVCWGGAANDTFNVTGGTGIKLRGGDSADVYNISTGDVDMQLGYGNDTVNVTAGDNQQIKANLGINTINLTAGSGHVITADIDQAASKKVGKDVGYGVDKLYITDGAKNVTANLGDGKDIVDVYGGSKHKIYTEGWGDTITVIGNTGGSIIDSGAGDDKITLNAIGTNEVYGGADNDTINIIKVEKWVYEGSTNINYRNPYTKVSGGAGNDQFNFSSVAGYYGYTVLAFGGSGKDVFDLNCGNVIAYGGNGNDIFYCYPSSYQRNNYIVGGAGDDTYYFDMSGSLEYKYNYYYIDNEMYSKATDKDVLSICNFSGSINDVTLLNTKTVNNSTFTELQLKDNSGNIFSLEIKGFDTISKVHIHYTTGENHFYGTGSEFRTYLERRNLTTNKSSNYFSWNSVYAEMYPETKQESFGSIDDFISRDSDLIIAGNGYEK